MIHRLFIIYASDSKFKDFLGTFQPIGIYHTPSQSYKVSYYYSIDMKKDFFKSFFFPSLSVYGSFTSQPVYNHNRSLRATQFLVVLVNQWSINEKKGRDCVTALYSLTGPDGFIFVTLGLFARLFGGQR